MEVVVFLKRLNWVSQVTLGMSASSLHTHMPISRILPLLGDTWHHRVIEASPEF